MERSTELKQGFPIPLSSFLKFHFIIKLILSKRTLCSWNCLIVLSQKENEKHEIENCPKQLSVFSVFAFKAWESFSKLNLNNNNFRLYNTYQLFLGAFSALRPSAVTESVNVLYSVTAQVFLMLLCFWILSCVRWRVYIKLHS